MEQLPHDIGETLAAGGFRLDGLCVDPATGRIEGPGGCEQVDPIVMAVLAVLIEDSGGVVTRAQLLDRVWHDRVVTEDVVSRCVYQLRQHLVRAGGDKRYRKLIETLPRRGYRLQGRVVPVVREAETTAAGAQGPEAGRRSSRSPRSRTALLFVLMATLIAFWWHQQSVVSPMRANAVESPSIADAIANGLGLSFRAPEPIAARPYGDGDAYVDHLHARHLMHRRNAGDLDEAIILFERAVGGAPKLADAWAGLSTAAWLRAEDMHGGPDQLVLRNELMEKARWAGERALALEPDHVEALLRLSRIALRSGDFECASSLYVRARRAAPNDPTLLALDAGSAFGGGDYDAAIRLSELALEQDPLATAWRGNLALYLNRAGHVDRAQEEAMRVIGLSDGRLREHMRTLLVEIALHQGRIDDARNHVETITEPVERAYAEALLYSDTGESAAAREAIARLEAVDHPIARIRLAEVLAFRGEDEAAISIVRDLERWTEEDNSSGQISTVLGNIAASRSLGLLRDHPEWPSWTDQRPWTPPPRNDVQLVESR